MAIDISKRNIGVAVSDEGCTFVAHYTSFSGRKDVRINLRTLVTKYKPHITVVGLPIPYGKQHNTNFNYVKNMAHILRDVIKPYIFINEQMSSNLGEKLQKMNNSKKTIDAIAAAILLQYVIVAKHKVQNMLDTGNFQHIL